MEDPKKHEFVRPGDLKDLEEESKDKIGELVKESGSPAVNPNKKYTAIPQPKARFGAPSGKKTVGINYDPLPWTDFYDEKIMLKDVSRSVLNPT